MAEIENVYGFSFKDVEGKEVSLSQFAGKVMLIVNTASKCGFTSQYKGLQALYDKYRSRGFVVIAVPSNDFFAQEPLSNEQIQEFCSINYQITFPVMSKERVKTSKAHPFYLFTAQHFGAAPKWNFHKYLIDRSGKLANFFYPLRSPQSLEEEIEKLLN